MDAGDMRVWVGCLACYNNGRLIGQWIGAGEAGDLTPEDVHGKETSHEELWCFDYEGFGGLLKGECSPVEATRIYDVALGLDTYYSLEAFAAYVDHEGCEVTEEAVEAFTEAYCGEYRSGAEYAEMLAEDIGAIQSNLGWPYSCIDWDKAWRELRIGGDNYEVDAPGGVYIFRNI